MNRSLNQNEIDYVLYHLDLVMNTQLLKAEMVYQEHSGELVNTIILTSINELMDVKYINDLPILFPSSEKEYYSMDEKGNLIFHHDFLKSSFYLLSGYDEHFVNLERDHWGRVRFAGSIQKKLNSIDRPLVNEYFQLIFDGINAYLKHHNRPQLEKKKLFKSFGFLLSHDIDIIDKYGWPHLGYKIKELVGLASSPFSKKKLMKATIQSFFQFINPWRSNPYWNFKYLTRLEKNFNINASYYFLSKDADGGSAYTFDLPRLKKLFHQISEKKHEIGIHGTTKTATNANILKSEIESLESVARLNVVGGRQHRLWLDPKVTFKVHQEAGLHYDSSFGFAEHEGFRNSFCLPFKPYDFENEKAYDCWQFPLMVMDVTLFSYRRLNAKEALASIHTMVKEVKKHHGIFTLLWHNSFFDQVLYPDLKNTYESILRSIANSNPDAITGKSLVELLNETSNEDQSTH